MFDYKKIFFAIVIASVLVIFSSCSSLSQAADEQIAISSFDELERLPQIKSARKLTVQEINSAYVNVGFGRRDESDFDNIVVYEIFYNTSDGAEVMGIISAPLDYLDTAYPVTIRNRGNSNIPRGIGQNRYALITRGVNWSEFGYITLLSYYRDAPYSASSNAAANEDTKHDQWGGDDLNDVLGLIDMAELFSFKGDGMFMEGHSRGGMMTYMALREDSRIDAAIVSGAVSDNAESYEEWKSMFNQAIGGSPDEFAEEYYRRSAVNWAEEITTPLLIMHGAIDEVVSVSQSQKVYDKMEEAGRDVTFKVYENTGHIFNTEMLKDAMEWLEIQKAEL